MNLIESHRVEHKQFLTDTFEKEVVAFLNYHEGGIIYIGVDKDGKIVGCQNPDVTQLKIKDKLKHNISPSCLGLFEVILETIEEKPVIKIIIASGRETPYYIKKNGMSEKGCYIRVGNSSEPMNQTMIEDLFAKRVRNSLGNIKSRRQDLTFEQLKIYYEEKGLKLNEKFASNLELLTDDVYYNYVAYLMADSNGVSIKVAKYAGTNKVDLIENNEYGYCSLIKATKRVLEKLEIENKTAALITSTNRKEQPLWNKVAIREAVINAIVHNDYTTENPPVFEIFSDRIEITSTGGLSIIKNIDDFFSGYSNPTSRELMRIYKDLELVEHLGSGLNRILEAYDKDSFVIKQNYMKNIFYKNETPLDGVVSGGVNGVVSGGVRELLEFIQTNPGLRANELSEHIDTPLRTVQRWLKQLKDENKIEFQGAPKTGGYVVIYDDIKNNS
uniref:RNA-binding domain-containing protein n=1 Tax=Aliarcobacter sp. TaxID=2321116 RepID=UPI004047F976